MKTIRGEGCVDEVVELWFVAHFNSIFYGIFF